MGRTRRRLWSVACLLCLELFAAGPAGVWEGQFTLVGPRGEMSRTARLDLALEGVSVSGTLTSQGSTAKLLDGTVKGNEVSFAIASGASDVPRFEFHGRLDDDTLTFVVTGKIKGTEKDLKLGSGSFKRKR